jgi:beta-N-acetylhexosaminidase
MIFLSFLLTLLASACSSGPDGRGGTVAGGSSGGESAASPAYGPAQLPPRETGPGPAEYDPLVEQLISTMSLRQRIGQRFIAPVPGRQVTDGADRAIREMAPAGFIFYPWNFETAEDVRQLAESITQFTEQVTPGISPFLCADQEGGRVATFRFPESVRLPAAHHMGQLGPDFVEAAAYLTALQMKNLGLNMNLAPVLDTYGIPDRSIIGDRSYSGNPHTVAAIAGPYLRGSRAGGVISVAKHFPGHGSTTVDSHSRLPVMDTSLEDLRARDLIPFAAAIESGVEVIMTAHILFESIDPEYPVTLSQVFLTSILREQLGFTGVVMSDGLEMGAIRDNFDLNRTLVRLFRYDVDLILLFSNYDVVDLVDRVEYLIRIGEISEDDVDRGVRRVLRLKIRNGLARPA